MKVHDIITLLESEMHTKTTDDDTEITGGYTSDLLSDVMGNAAEGDVLITIQAHKNTVAVANLVGMPAIVLCNGRAAPEDMVRLAEEQGIAIITSPLNQFITSCRIGSALEKN